MTALARDVASKFETAKGGLWHRQTLKKILQRPANAGIRVYKGKEVGQGQWEPITDRATYDVAMALLDRTSTLVPDKTNVHLLSAIAKYGLQANC